MFLLLAVVMAIGVIEATERSIERSKGEMTLAEFDNTKWGANMFAEYKGKNYPVAACDFDERLIALEGVTLGSDTPDWVRCENVKLATSLTDVKEVLSKFKGKAN